MRIKRENLFLCLTTGKNFLGAMEMIFSFPVLGTRRGKNIRSIAPKTVVGPSNPISINDDNTVNIKRIHNEKPILKPGKEIGSIEGFQRESPALLAASRHSAAVKREKMIQHDQNEYMSLGSDEEERRKQRKRLPSSET